MKYLPVLIGLFASFLIATPDAHSVDRYAFTAAAPIEVGNRPTAIASGDFNLDGIGDLAVVLQESEAPLKVLLGSGTGTFSPPVPLNPASGDSLARISVADIDGDGIDDIIVGIVGVAGAGTPESGGAAIVFGNRDGIFSSSLVLSLDGQQTFGVATVDANLDGAEDLLLSTSANRVLLALNDRTGGFDSFTEVLRSGCPIFLDQQSIADLNEDGISDLVYETSCFRNGVISVRLGDGEGGFSDTSLSVPVVNDFIRNLVIDDFSSDGHLDAVVISGQGMSFLFGDGNGGLSLGADIFTQSSPSLGQSSDFDGDGNVDVALLFRDQGEVAIYPGTGRGVFEAPHVIQIDNLPSTIAVARFDGNASPDLAVASLDLDVATILLSSGPIVSSVSGVVPRAGGNIGSVTVRISLLPEEFSGGQLTVKLTAPGLPEIIGEPVILDIGSVAYVRFDLTDAPLGLRDIEIVNSSGSTRQLVDAFEVEVGRQARIWIDLTGRIVCGDECNAIYRPGRPQRFMIAYGNRGNVDVAAAVLMLTGIPGGADFRAFFDFETTPSNLRPLELRARPMLESPTEIRVPIHVKNIPAGFFDLLPIEITVEEEIDFDIATHVLGVLQ